MTPPAGPARDRLPPLGTTCGDTAAITSSVSSSSRRSARPAVRRGQPRPGRGVLQCPRTLNGHVSCGRSRTQGRLPTAAVLTRGRNIRRAAIEARRGRRTGNDRYTHWRAYPYRERVTHAGADDVARHH